MSWIFFRFVGSMIFPYEALYIRALGASGFIIGLIGALGQATLFTSRILGGYVADKYGRRDIIVAMTFGLAASYAFYAVAPDWRLIAVGVVVQNLCLLYQPALSAITADSIPPEKRGLGYAMANVLPEVPAIFAPLVARLLIEEFGFLTGMRIAYWITVLGSLIAADIRLLFLKETLKTGEKLRARELIASFRRSVAEMGNAWKLMPRQLKIFTVILLISAFEEPVFHLFMSLYAVDRVGITEPDWALLSVAWSAVMMVVGLPLGKAVDVMGRKRALVLAYLFWTPSTVYFILCRSFTELLIVLVFFAIGGALFNPACQALMADLTPREARGRIMATIGNLNLVAAAAASAVAGYLYDMNPMWPFLACVGLGVLTFTLVVILLREPERREE